MKIILSNYRYFISGGPERYLFSIKNLLEKKGNDVFPFSIKSHWNVKSAWNDYFLSPLGDGEAVYFSEYNKNIKTMLKVLVRCCYSPEGFIKARRLARDVQGDIAYSLHFLNKMSPSIIDGFKSVGLPVVVRISDFGVICPQGHLFYNGRICEACINKGFGQAIMRRCIKGSWSGSAIKVWAWRMHRLLGSLNRVDAWVFPSKFTRQKFLEAGIDGEKLHYVPTFIDAEAVKPDFESQGYFLFFGRLVEEKGVHVLLEAYRKLIGDKPRLVIIGTQGDSDYSRNLIARFGQDAEFLKFMRRNELGEYIRKSMAVVVPSLWYDNLPNVLLESYAYGKPVIAPRHGCFSEYVNHGMTGLLYNTEREESLIECLDWARLNTASLRDMGRSARKYVIEYHSPKTHYEILMELFTSLT